MAKSKGAKKNKLIWVLFILVGVMAVFIYNILYNGNVVLKKTDSIDVIQKLKNIQVRGGKFQLTQNDDIISKLNSKIIYVKDNSIKINSSMLPFNIVNFKILDNKILFTATTLDKVTNDGRQNAKKKELKKLKAEAEKKSQQQRAIRNAILIKTRSELKNAYSDVVTSKEQKLIKEISSTLSKMIANPTYNSALDKASIKSIYRTLDATSKDRVKSALFWNIDGDSIDQLRHIFGL